MADLAGQTVFPFAAEPVPPPNATVPEGGAADLAAAVPRKASLTIPEAAEFIGVSDSQVRNLIDAGVLLTTDVSAEIENGMRRHNRVRTRLPRPFEPAREKFLTVEEFIVKRSNING